MVDWDRVQQLRAEGRDWAEIATDPKVDFHPDASAGSPGRALRALYHRTRRHAAPASAAPISKRVERERQERKWTVARVGYLTVPLVGLWLGLAFAAPSPVGLLVPAVPYLALAFAGVALLLLYALLRRTGPRWSAVYRRTVIGGVVVGLVVAGGIGLAGALVFGCPYLPPSTSLASYGGPGWSSVPVAAWQAGGAPVVFFYGATWCPYCSASSWAIYKAISEFASVGGIVYSHSSLSDVYPGTPEAVLAGAFLGARNGHGPAIAFQVAEDTSGVEGTLPGTSSCYQSAYVTSYSSGIPFLVINGQVLHVGTLVDPQSLASWNYATDGTSGPSTVWSQVSGESGAAWTAVQDQAWWIMAYIAKDLGWTTSTIVTYGGSSYYGWSTATLNAVSTDLSSIT